MQLKRIQLIGFKSFVDHTSIPVMSQMNAIVGPNGCGKSNIVDAIRWVTGEMSAKQLRGQSMSDVIFNGTSGRKPVGKAAVELTFDNSDRRITGEYAAFSEISIRREVVRDGQSNYFINGVPARRRDLVDLFLGTGLGPRSYAIIEQGMIAQLVEAKPEDLRSHFEEVAGISKYRERRRETENRIRHTQDNLDRLNDLRDELGKQLRHLQRQSEAAEKYKVLQQELRLLHAQMKALQWNAYEEQLKTQKEQLAAVILEHDAQVTAQTECETHIEKSRIETQHCLDAKENVQKKFYGLGSEIARLEQQIAHKQEQLKQWERELSESGSLFSELTTQATAQTEQIELLQKELSELKPQSHNLSDIVSQANQRLESAQSQMKQAQQAYDAFQETVNKTNQQLEIAKNNARHYEAQKQQCIHRHAQLETQLATIAQTNTTDEIESDAKRVDDIKVQLTEAQNILLQLSEAIQQQRQAYTEAQSALSAAQGELQKTEAQAASLHALQQASLEDHQAETKSWLKEQGLSQQKQLGKLLQVEAGWELAVETILGDYLDAVHVDSIDAMQSALSGFAKGDVTLLDQSAQTHAVVRQQKTVLSVVKPADKLPAWMSGIFIAETLADALQQRSTLQATESIVTRDGIWIGSNWLRVARTQSSEEGFLMREKKLAALESDIQVQRDQVAALKQKQIDAKTTLEQLETKRDEQQRLSQEITRTLTEAQTSLSAKQSRIEALSQEHRRLTADIESLQTQLTECEKALAAASESIASLSETQQSQSVKRDELLQVRLEAENHLSATRTETQAKKQQADEWHIKLSSVERQLSVLTQSLNANQKQLLQLTERRQTLQKQIDDVHAPLHAWAESLQEQLSQRVMIENELRDMDTRYQSEQNQLRQLENTRERLIKLVGSLQAQQQQLRMDQQEMVVRQKTLKEQLAEMQFDIDALFAQMPEEANLAEWESRSNELQHKVDRLGPINLAAIDEFKELTERKNYMDQQVTDLVEALEVLQNAIRKIDRETRHLFKDTFDQVNKHFSQLFPRIFGGGQAELSLTDDDLLTTGIIVKAQPPGKRNTTIHMLSGGEKTLTAISLMFAMFQLNPAPFCVLDEVDAPLDDLNVGRYCQLVKEMSQDTQFLIISHNKVTIQTADHLMGVTMQEPGVSRIVSVDIQEAVAMAES